MTGRWLGCIGGHQRCSLDNRQLFFSQIAQKKDHNILDLNIAGQLDSVECFSLGVFVVHSARPDGNGRVF